MKFIVLNLCICLTGFIAWSAPAFASPWTLPADELVLTLDQSFQFADREFLPNGKAQVFPLQGSFRSHTTRAGARYGFTDRFEGALDLNFAMVSYRADPFILEDFDEGATAGEATDAIINFNTTEFGAADFVFYGRYNVMRRALLITTETSVKLPTGYLEPTGTFVETGTGGQATLGDGQSDLTQRLLLGTYIPATKTFARLDAGLRFRFGSPGHQGLADFRAGQFLGDNVIFTAGVGWIQTLTQGEPIGQTFIAKNPSIAASETTVDTIDIVDLRLDRDALNVYAGMLFRVGEMEFAANYGHTVLGTNTAAIHAISIGAIFAIPNATSR